MSRTAESGPQRRGEQLRRHILFVAKDVFLEAGFERASMDTVALRAGTSKRSLYSHFESKDKLFLAVLGLVRDLYLGRLKTPDAYADEPVEAVAVFCGRFLQLMVWEPQVRTCRLVIAEAERLPDSATAYYDAIVASAHERLAAYLTEHGTLGADAASAMARDLLGRTVLPRLFRTLLAVEKPAKNDPAEETLATDVDLEAIRQVAAAVLPPPRS
jgi:AcrR family transcriptional regulator